MKYPACGARWLRRKRWTSLVVAVGLTAGRANAVSDVVWTTKAPMPTDRDSVAAAVVGGTIYAIGGGYGGTDDLGTVDTYLGTVEAYDPATDSWTTKASMTARSDPAAAAVGRTIYAIGGQIEYRQEGWVEAYDSATDRWTRKADMPTARSGLSTAVVGGIIYAIGGRSGMSICALVEAYDTTTDTWSSRASMPVARNWLSTAVVGGTIFAIGGQLGIYGAESHEVDAYDSATNTWTRKADMPTARFGLSTAVVGGIIYAIGGRAFVHSFIGDFLKDPNKAQVCISVVEAYDQNSNRWISKTSMPTARWRFAAVTAGEIIYAIGGFEERGEGEGFGQEGEIYGEHTHVNEAATIQSRGERNREKPTTRVTRPPRLEVRAKLETEKRDGVLDADSKGRLTCWIKNTGAGPATKVTIGISHKPGGAWLTHPEPAEIETIEVGREVKIELPLAVGRDAPEGRVVFRIVVKEGNGFDADPAEYPASSREFRSPNLRLGTATVFDGQEGYAFGNGNGIIEPGESAEMRIRLENAGRGPTKGSTLSAVSRDPNVIVLAINGKDGSTANLGDLKAGQVVEVRVAVAVTKRYPGGAQLPCELKLGDLRTGLDQVLELPVKVAKASSRTKILSSGNIAAPAVTAETVDRPLMTVAVADLSPSEGTPAGEATIASEWLRGAIVGIGYFKVVERANMQKVLSEQAVQQTGCTQQDCAVRLGKLLNVQRMVVGTFGTFGGSYVMNVRVVDVETGQAVYADEAFGKTKEEITQAVRSLADRIAKNMR